MPARDRLHNAARNALVRDGWTITHDPLRLTSGRRSLYVDLGAERLLAAEKGSLRIAVEVKTFSGPSDVDALEQAMGQHVLYRALLAGQDPGRLLFLAVPDDVWNTLFQEPIGETALAHALDRVILLRPRRRKDHPVDTPAEWRDLIEGILTEETRVPVSYGEVALYTVFDRAQDHYLLMAVGWDGHKRVHAPLLHVDILDGKIWIQHDGTERGVARDLEAAGIPKDHIVLAFQHINRRRYGDYAAA